MRLSVAQADEDLGALVGREGGGEIRLALQIGPLDEAENAGYRRYQRNCLLRARRARARRRR